MGKRLKFLYVILMSVSLTGGTSHAASGAVGNIDIQQSEATLYSYALPNSTDHISEPSYAIAIRFVRSSGLHKSLSLLLLDSVKSDEMVENAITRYGFDAVKNKVVSTIKITTTDYRSDWDSLLASIYSSQFNAQVLQSITEGGEKSPYFTDFIARQQQLSTSEKLHSSDVFKKARSKLIKSLEKTFAT